MRPWKRRGRRAGGRGGFAVWMLVTVGLLVPSQWYAYSRAMRSPGDQTFPISAWRDARYFPARSQARTLRPLLPRIIEEAAADRARSGSTNDPAPEPSPEPQPTPRPSPSSTRSESPTPSPSPTPTSSSTPTPTPRSSPPRITMRAQTIDAPDNSGSLFYRWTVEISNPSDGDWLDDVHVVTQIPLGTERVDCRRIVGFSAPNPAAAPGYRCDSIAPPASDDGHEMGWEEENLRPGYSRVYSFDVRVTAGDGQTIRDHSHLYWTGYAHSVKTGTCSFTVRRSSPKSCSAES